MITQRNIAVCILLSIITCGIYGIYWFIVLTNDIGRVSNDPSFTGGKHFLLTIVTCGIWTFIWAYQVGKHIAHAQYHRGYQPNDNSLLYVLLPFLGLGIVVYALAQHEVNQLA